MYANSIYSLSVRNVNEDEYFREFNQTSLRNNQPPTTRGPFNIVGRPAPTRSTRQIQKTDKDKYNRIDIPLRAELSISEEGECEENRINSSENAWHAEHFHPHCVLCVCVFLIIWHKIDMNHYDSFVRMPLGAHRRSYLDVAKQTIERPHTGHHTPRLTKWW